MDRSEGFLEVGRNEQFEVVVNHPDLKPDANGVGHIVFSPDQARYLARLLNEHAARADRDRREAEEAARMAEAADIPVDRSSQQLISGDPVPEDRSHTRLRPSGQQEGYVVLTSAERAKGFVRPLRTAYIHVGKPPEGEDYSRFEYPIRGGVKPFPGGCLTRTKMVLAIAETYARDPGFYDGTFCVSCGTHRPLEEFIWEGTTERVGS